MPSSGLVGVSTQMICVSLSDRGPDRVDVGDSRRGPVQTPALGDLGEEPERAAVRVVRDHHVVARPADGAQQRVLGGQAAGEREAAPAALQRGQALLQRVAGRVGRPRVLVSQSRRADGVLGVGGGLVDRWHHRAGARLGLLARVDGQRLEAEGHARI